ncbi:MAG: type II secretion system F family protein [Fimbriimonas sp.]|nr:type II secretion system F family protein [Fimbriimonas sp.]
MVSYAYKGIDGKGVRVEGAISANSIEDAENRLSKQDISVLALRRSGEKVQKNEQTSVLPEAARHKISPQDAAGVLRNLAVMAETGVPFIEAIDAVIGSARTPRIEAALRLVKEGVVGGQGISGALRLAPNMFAPIIVDMIRVAETGGRLDQALDNGAAYMERAADLKRKIVNAMLYPSVMLGVSSSTILVLIIFVMPRFAVVFKQMKAELPLTTQVMLKSGDFIRSQPLMSAVGLVAFIVGLTIALKNPVSQRMLSGVAARMPLLGELMKRLALARSLQSISTLVASNVPLLAAIEAGARVAGHAQLEKALYAAKDDIERGSSMSEALGKHAVFPKQVIQLVAVGERTGRLPQLLSTVCKSMETEVDGRLKALVSVVEPLMIVGMGLIVGSITMSIIGPIYSAVENIR